MKSSYCKGMETDCGKAVVEGRQDVVGSKGCTVLYDVQSILGFQKLEGDYLILK